jgi:hypothetical protein
VTDTDDPNPWAHERAPQLDTASLSAFGIRLTSRLAQAQEMIELIGFAHACADAGVNLFVSEAFYDSRQGCCHFKLSSALQAAGESAARAVLAAAAATLSQFEWAGSIHHGRDDPARRPQPRAPPPGCRG